MHVVTGPYAPPEPARRLTAASADGAQVNIEVHGPEGAPAVVLVHGWTCSIAFWAPVVRALEADHRVIAYDQRGHGRSSAAGPGGYSTNALADDLEAVLRAALAPGERAVLAGHSMGGVTLMAAAGRSAFHDHTAAALVCSSGSSRLVEEATVLPLRPGRLRTRIQRTVLGSSAPLGPVTPVGKRILRYMTMGPASSPVMIEACARIVHACPRAVRSGWAKDVLATLDVDANLQQLTVPTTVLVGTADRLTPAVLSRRLAAALPHCEGLLELPGLGHMTPVESPGAVTDAIRTLVTRHLAPGTRTSDKVKEETP
jgi:pimeloyl-ACP methyl ester carboxylesterase